MHTKHQPLLKPVIGYLRVSTMGQHDTQDLDRQRARLEEWAIANGHQLVEVYLDVADGKLGHKVERPGLYDALSAALDNKLPLVVPDPSRLARSGFWAERLDDKCHKLVFLFVDRKDENITWVEEVKLYHEVLPDVISEGTIVAMDRHKRRGKKFGSPDGLLAGRISSLNVRRSKMDTTIDSVAAILVEKPENMTLSHKALSEVLNDRGKRTSTGKLFDQDRVRAPRSAALQKLKRAADLDCLIDLDLPAGPLVAPAAALEADQPDQPVTEVVYPEGWGRF